MLLLDAKDQLTTGKGTPNETVQRAGERGFEIVESGGQHLKANKFDRLYIGLNGSPCWLTVGLEWVSSGGRLFGSSMQLNKEQAIQMMMNLKSQIDKMKEYITAECSNCGSVSHREIITDKLGEPLRKQGPSLTYKS